MKARAVLLVFISLLVAGPQTIAKEGFEERMQRIRLLMKKQDRANELRPARPDGPNRYLNISDDEVREVQLAVSEVLPRAIVNISAVTVGCPCEDGPLCTDQVWILATRSERTHGLLLSRIQGKWMIGPVQRWWLRYEALLERLRSSSNADELQSTDKLYGEFPLCLGVTDPVSTKPPD